MQKHGDRLLFSPSDLNAFLECEHLTSLEVQRCRAGLPAVEIDDAEARLRRSLGLEHETACRRRFVADGCRVVDIASPGGSPEAWSVRANDTLDAMRAGADVIYQGVLVDGDWRGIADFIVRVPRPSLLGAWSYEVWDTKLGRHAKPTYAVQLSFYTERMAEPQGVVPDWMCVVLGDGQMDRLKPSDFLAYYRSLRRRFMSFIESSATTSPYPVEHCAICQYSDKCLTEWRETDHLCLVAGIRRETVARLEKAGVRTMAGLATCTTKPDRAINDSTFATIRDQAALQRSFIDTGSHAFQLVSPAEERGFALLPEPSPGDLFFDMEGYPYYEPTSGLEYLFGVAWLEGETPRFRPWWGTDRDQEKAAFEAFIDFVRDRLRQDPNLHVYHYASYERTKLGVLAQQHATREEELDDLLRRQVFVDLYKVVRQALRTSHDGYSLKDIRQFFMPAEALPAAVATASDSVVAFAEWLLSKDPALLTAIEQYNSEDCISTLRLRDWLLDRRKEAVAQFGIEIPWREAPDAASEPVSDPDDRNADLRAQLLAVQCNEPEATARRVLAGLLDYHRREDKPEWWEYFDRFESSMQELMDDPGAIVGLEIVGDPDPPIKPSRSWTYPLTYPDQEHSFDVGDKPENLQTRKAAGTIATMNHDDRVLGLKLGAKPGSASLPSVVVGGKPIESGAQREAVRAVAEHFASAGFEDDGRYRAIGDVLLRRAPRVRGREPGGPIQTLDLEEQKRVVRGLDGSALVIQGPPGSGKTWTAGRLIVSLLEAGARVGVAAFSHRAVRNVLEEVENVASDRGLNFTGLKKSTADRPDSVFERRCIHSQSDLQTCLQSGAQLLAGTPYFFPRLPAEALDYLFMDEAGQMSLGDAVAVGSAAKNLVLLGDPQQLPQLTHGVHSAGAGASVLEHYLAGQSTVPVNRGLFLATTYRMHPDICAFVSELSYDGRLESDPSCSRQVVASKGLSGTGLCFLPVEHRGNARLAVEEADVVAREVRELLCSGSFTDRRGDTRKLTPADILVVSPYNMQRRCLRERLPAGVEVGTVDKFQGREAAVVFFSMATSSGDDLPRGVDFLFNKNRLNVAVSRARCLSVLVASPRLLEVRCRTLEQMTQVNGLCRFVEAARC